MPTRSRQGPNKAMGSPFEPMPNEHRNLLQGIVNEFYGRFTNVVATNRAGLSDEHRSEATDGRVVTGVRAAEIGLVDQVGDLRDAFAAAKRRAGIDNAKLVKYHRPLEHVGSAYAYAPNAPATGTQLNLMQLNIDAGLFNDQPGFYYLWDPSAWWGESATK